MCPGCEGSAKMLPARFLVLDPYKSRMKGRLAPMIHFADLTVRCSLGLSCLEAEGNQTEMAVHSTDCMMEV